VSETRYELLNSLFDRLITFRLKELNAAWKAIHEAEKKLGANPNPAAKKLLADARKSAAAVPITEKEASDPAIAGAFQELKKGQKAAGRQAEFESKWDDFAVKSYAEAKALTAK
ncbi:MAG: ABC transporter substrate-binding protein, partial [Variibacter sp.]|nr:ABC transporter substrate-binding protein [Variibacter sp.]